MFNQGFFFFTITDFFFFFYNNRLFIFKRKYIQVHSAFQLTFHVAVLTFKYSAIP